MNRTAGSNDPDIRPGTCWPGAFGHPDTTALLNLNPRFFSFQRIREKRWCYAGVFHPDIIFGCAVIHLGYICSAFVFGFDRKHQQMTEHTAVFPPLGQARYDRNPESGICSYRSPAGHLHIHHGLPSGATRISTNFRLSGKSLKASVELMLPDTGLSPMHFLMPMESQQRAFTTKAAGLDAVGEILLDDRQYNLRRPDTFSVLDWTNGFYPRKTSWNWACGAGQAEDGTRIGFNFSTGVYKYGVEENSVWINGVPHPTGPVDFIYDSANPRRPWRVTGKNGSVQLVFQPEGIRRANDNFGVVKSRFIQPCGRYSGTIRIGSGRTAAIRHISGVAEEHFAKW